MKTDFSCTKSWETQQTLWQSPGLAYLTAKCISSTHVPSVGSFLTFKRRMSVICDGQPAPLPPNDSYMRRAAAVTSIGPDIFMRSNKAIATDQDPCPWMKLSFPVKTKFELPTVWQILTSKLEITFFFHTRRKV